MLAKHSDLGLASNGKIKGEKQTTEKRILRPEQYTLSLTWGQAKKNFVQTILISH